MEQKKSAEIENLLNPAFCGVVCVAIVEGYNSKSKTNIPFYLPYILLPIVLHLESRTAIPSTSVTKFHLWIQGHDHLRIGFVERTRNLEQFVSEGMRFLHGQGLIEIDDEANIILTNTAFKNKVLSKSQAISEYVKKAKIIGSMCGKTNSGTAVLAMLGIRL